MSTYFHATSRENLQKIVDSGMIKKGIDNIVYLADSAENALGFMSIRLFGEPIIVFEVELPDEAKLYETFDHSFSFFQCKAYGYPDNIPLDNVPLDNVVSCKEYRC